ncbi:MAG: heavy metal translocating P-type ATPase [Gammaproteobacteria bacterium]|nr:heavy metal translocating P-type ATPase [Gammaproteobacteria bacterium]
MTSGNCSLCNLPVPATPIQSSNHQFCCYGCLGVFEIFGEDVLKDKKASVQTQKIEAKDGECESYFKIKGMHCSSCEILIKKCAEKVAGISYVSTNYATSSARVIFDPKIINAAELQKKLSIAGYRAYSYKDKEFDSCIDDDTALLKVIIATGLAGLVMMLNLAFFYPMDLGIVSKQELMPLEYLVFHVVPVVMFVTTTLLVFLLGFPILRGAFIGFRAGALNMDNLLSIAILSAWGYSLGQLMMDQLDLYFDVAAMIVGVVSVGRYFEYGAKVSATRELDGLLRNWSSAGVRLCVDGIMREVTIEEVKPYDQIVVRQGEYIPLDGQIISGHAAIDESLITGETFPLDRGTGENVLGGATVVEGDIVINIGETVTSQIDNLADIFWNLQSSKDGSTSVADRIAKFFIPLVLLLAGIVTIVLLSSGASPSYALLAGLTTLIVSCPCTFGLATPLSTATAISTALKRKIIVTSADIFEKNPDFSTVAIDKTGTLSAGKMHVVEVVGDPMSAMNAAAVEHYCVHPIARAIAKLGDKAEIKDLTVHPGKGAVAMVDDNCVAVGSRALFALLAWDIPTELVKQTKKYLSSDFVVSWVGWDSKVRGAIVTQDQQRPEWQAVVSRLRNDKRVVLVTGAEQAEDYEQYVDDVFTGIPPEAKVSIINQLKSNNDRVIMVGDGSNDAPALAAADLGIAFGTPTALAAQAADIVIPGNNMKRIFTALDLIAITRRRIRQNITWAFLYNAIAIPLALTGQLNPLFAALAMASSSLLVVWNSSRVIEGLND